MLLLAIALSAIGHNLYVTAASTKRINGVSDDKADVKSYDIEVPEACKGLNYCMIKPDDSPQDEINKFFEYEDMLLHEPRQNNYGLRRKRMQSNDEIPSLCESVFKYQKLYAVLSNNKWYEAEPGPNNNHHIELCLNSEAPCLENLQYPNIFETICRQKMRIIQVQVRTNEGEMKTVHTSLPNGCSCEVKQFI